MRQIWDFVKTTVLGGAIFLLPIAAILVIAVKAGKMAIEAATPLAEKLPFPKGEAILAIYVVGVMALVLEYLSRQGFSHAQRRSKVTRYRFSKTAF